MNALLRNLQSQASLRWAIYQSINRAQGASDAGDSECELKQVQWAKHFAIPLEGFTNTEKSLRDGVAAVMGSSFVVTGSQIAALSNAIASGQLPTNVGALLVKSQMSNLTIAR